MEIKGYITNLGKYNEGELIGEWIEFPIDEDELEEVYERIQIGEDYEEIFFTDWEYDYDFGFGEYENINRINELAERLESLCDEQDKALSVLLDCGDYDLENALAIIEKGNFNFSPQSKEEWCLDLIEEGRFGQISRKFICYMDIESFANDWMDDCYEGTAGTVEVW